MTYAKEIKGEWYGVAIPSWLRAFDCREDDAAPAPRTSWGARLWSTDRATVDMGLRGEGFSYDTRPLSCSTYIDARRADKEELARQVRRMIEAAEKLRAERIEAESRPAKPGKGGSVLYHPVAIAMANYGWAVISDQRTAFVRGFEGD